MSTPLTAGVPLPRTVDPMPVEPLAVEPLAVDPMPVDPLPAGSGSVLLGLVASCRPRQWTKNVLVAAAPVAAGTVLVPHVLGGMLLAVVGFIGVSSALYLLNDVADLRRDRLHPRKRLRPIAAGLVPVRTALAAGLALLAVSLTLGTVLDPALGAVLAAYAAITIGYSAGLKRMPGVELVLLTSGFVLRPLAGSAATGVPVSAWFLAVALSGAGVLAVGKRFAEVQLLGARGAAHRATLRRYSVLGLRQARDWLAGLTVGLYAAWAWNGPDPSDRWINLASAIPFALGLARYIWCNDRGAGGAPEEVVLRDRPLQLIAAAYLLLFLAGV